MLIRLPLLAALLAVFLSAAHVSADDKFKVALILPGSDTDHGWNQMASEGLDQIKKELGAATKKVTDVQSADFFTQLSYFGDEGYNVVICHGGEFEKAAGEAAKKYPQTHYIVGGCPADIPGATTIDFQVRDASELVGIVAAEVSKTRKVAFVGAEAVPPLQACYDGLSDGVKGAGNGTSVINALWTNSWDSPTAAREKTEAAIDAGADVIYQDVDAAAIGVFQAVQDANKNGKPVFAFGCNSNQNAMAPEVILGSVVLDVPKAYLDFTRDAQKGTLKTGAFKLGLEGGYVDLVLNDKQALITAAIKDKVAQRKAAILAKKP